MPPPIYLPDGAYPLAPRGTMVFDLNTPQGQDSVSVTNDTDQDNARYRISLDHAAYQTHTLDSGESDNYDENDGTHYHIDNIGAVALVVDIA